MEQLIIILHVLISIFLIVLVLLQQGKGATMGSSFGGGASGTVFGSSGSSGFLLKLTALFAGLFFVTSLILGYMAVQQTKDMGSASVMAPSIVMPAPAVVPPVPSSSSNKS